MLYLCLHFLSLVIAEMSVLVLEYFVDVSCVHSVAVFHFFAVSGALFSAERNGSLLLVLKYVIANWIQVWR